MRLASVLSFRSLTVVVLLAALIPFGSFFRAANSVVSSLTQRGQESIQRTADQVAMARLIQQRLTDLERKARWLLAFAEPDWRRADERKSYDKARALLKDALNDLLLRAENADDKELALLINQLSEKEQLADGQLRAKAAGAPAAALNAAFEGLQSVGNQLFMQVSTRLDQAIDDLRQESRRQQEHLRQEALIWAVIPVVIIVGLGLLQAGTLRMFTERVKKQSGGAVSEPLPHWFPAEMRCLSDSFECLRARIAADEERRRRMLTNLLGALKIPLGTLSESAAQLAGETPGELTPAQEDLVGQALAAAGAMHKLIDDFGPYVDASKHEDSAHTVTTHVDMQALIGNVITVHRADAEARLLRLNASLEAVTVVGNAERLQVMVDHLLTNAIKFSPDGGEIRIILREAGSRMKLEVEDDGPGIDDEERQRVFEPFFVGKAAGSLNAPGSGLGLSIVRECVTYHQGEIEIADARHPKRGARFRVQLPLEPNAQTHG